MVFGVGGSNGGISSSIKSSMAAGRHLGKLQRHRAVSLQQHSFLVITREKQLRYCLDM